MRQRPHRRIPRRLHAPVRPLQAGGDLLPDEPGVVGHTRHRTALIAMGRAVPPEKPIEAVAGTLRPAVAGPHSARRRCHRGRAPGAGGDGETAHGAPDRHAHPGVAGCRDRRAAWVITAGNETAPRTAQGKRFGVPQGAGLRSPEDAGQPRGRRLSVQARKTTSALNSGSPWSCQTNGVTCSSFQPAASRASITAERSSSTTWSGARSSYWVRMILWSGHPDNGS